MLGISVVQCDTGAAGMAYFEPGGVSFLDFSGTTVDGVSAAFAGCAFYAIAAGASC
jgi:hypothetical protein